MHKDTDEIVDEGCIVEATINLIWHLSIRILLLLLISMIFSIDISLFKIFKQFEVYFYAEIIRHIFATILAFFPLNLVILAYVQLKQRHVLDKLKEE